MRMEVGLEVRNAASAGIGVLYGDNGHDPFHATAVLGRSIQLQENFLVSAKCDRLRELYLSAPGARKRSGLTGGRS